MEVRRVKRTETKNKKQFIHFIKGEKIENNNRYLHYKENDVCFVQKSENQSPQIKEYHVYDKLMEKLDGYNQQNNNRIDKNKINKSLLINKFTNVFNISSQYRVNPKEENIINRVIPDQIKLIKSNLGNRFIWLKLYEELNDKLIIGLGGQSVFETDITLHHTYGIPYIPGSALKGVLRNYIIQEYCNESEKEANEKQWFVKIFGGKNDKGESVQGKVIFMDSFPCNTNFIIKRDIMTPHHSDYYSSEGENIQLPLDSDEPTPIPFLVVQNKGGNERVLFQINIAIDKSIAEDELEAVGKENQKNITTFIEEALKEALRFYGIGAKTSVGYGYFKA